MIEETKEPLTETQRWKTLFLIAVIVLFLVGGIVAARAIIGGQDEVGPTEKVVALSIVVVAPGEFTIDVTPKNSETNEPELVLVRGTSGQFTITTAAVDGFDGQIQFAFDGLPEGSWSFSTNPVTPGQTTTLTINTTTLLSNHVYVTSLSADDI